MAAEVKSDAMKGDAKFDAGVPKFLFDTSISNDAVWFDVSKDGASPFPPKPKTPAACR